VEVIFGDEGQICGVIWNVSEAYFLLAMARFLLIIRSPYLKRYMKYEARDTSDEL